MSLSKPLRREFLKSGALALIGSFAFSNRASGGNKVQELNLYVGTYTSPGKSEGIYLYRMNLESGALQQLNSFKSINPSYLAFDQKKRFLYAVNEIGDFEGKDSGAISAFAVDHTNGSLKLLNQQPSLGADPCYLSVDASSKFVLVANYTGGSVSVLPIRRDGSLGAATDHVQHVGSSVHENQKGPHAHCIILDRTNHHVLAADLGVDKVMLYQIDPNKGRLTPGKQPWVALKPGAGPRHIVLHPNGRYAYVINELDSTLTAFRYQQSDGSLVQLQTISTLPKDFSGHNDCADVHVSASGKFVYGSNRGHDSIVVFAINEVTGMLEYVEHVSTEGKTPRNFTLDPTGRFLLAANQNSDTIVSFRIDQVTGRLKPTGVVAEVPSPVCLKFA